MHQAELRWDSTWSTVVEVRNLEEGEGANINMGPLHEDTRISGIFIEQTSPLATYSFLLPGFGTLACMLLPPRYIHPASR
jgi:hypothetical protein